ncbi:hypothetical protein IWZ03DRAFT_11211 [Phyllosticta citriasiana]|uniref:Glycosyltransferase family 31 protein n=1 Tax=Phyllosticta citriasiana TaxID=595635 RepID=A0ABR1KYB3_9PEZI
MLPQVLHISKRTFFRVVAILLILGTLWHLRQFSDRLDVEAIRTSAASYFRHEEGVSCPPMPGMSDMLVVLKTGATEIPTKVPVALHTVLRCVPNLAIFSDYEETIENRPVQDVLAGIPDDIKASHPDFELYNRLQTGGGRSSISKHELDEWFNAPNTQQGQQGNPAWKLDKWKFLPNIDAAIDRMPNATWYVFVEADTYILFHNLADFLNRYDSRNNTPLYLGEPMQIGGEVFGYGGSGYALNAVAMRQVSKHRADNAKTYDDYTAQHWAGDCVLGKVLRDAGIPLTYAWPNIQGGKPSELDWGSQGATGAAGKTQKLWCSRAVSYHHVSTEEMAAMYRMQRLTEDAGKPLKLHRDIFNNFVKPFLVPEVDAWDNRSEEKVARENTMDVPIESFVECRLACEKSETCLQLAWSMDGGCRHEKRLKFGRPQDGSQARGTSRVTSGWMMDRVKKYIEDLGNCEAELEWAGS